MYIYAHIVKLHLFVQHWVIYSVFTSPINYSYHREPLSQISPWKSLNQFFLKLPEKNKLNLLTVLITGVLQCRHNHLEEIAPFEDVYANL